MAKLNYLLMQVELNKVGQVVIRDPEWDDEEYYNYIIHQFNLVFIKPYIVSDIEQSRRLGVNRTRNAGTGKFKNWKKR